MSLVLSEFDCPCCGENRMNPRTFDRFVLARDYAQVAFVMNSGWRCKKHNKDVGGKDTSSHPVGFAGDIQSVTSRHRFKALKALIEAGFTRIGIGKTFIHGDDDPNKDPAVMWLY